jgi:hypothetical protein
MIAAFNGIHEGSYRFAGKWAHRGENFRGYTPSLDFVAGNPMIVILIEGSVGALSV